MSARQARPSPVKSAYRHVGIAIFTVTENPVSKDLALGTGVTPSFSHHWVRMKGAVDDCVWITSCSF